MGALWAEDGKIAPARLGPHFEPKAKSVIFLFMCGGVSHIDTFDPKDNKHAGKLIDACPGMVVVVVVGVPPSAGGQAVAMPARANTAATIPADRRSGRRRVG